MDGATVDGATADGAMADGATADGATGSSGRDARERRKRRERRGIVAHLSAWLIRLIAIPFRVLPVPIACFAARRFADVLWTLAGSRRRVADENLRIAFGERLSDVDRRRIARESVRRFAMTLLEGLRLPGWIRTGRIDRMTTDGPVYDEALEAHRAGRPIIFFTGHMGSWEVGIRRLVRGGWRIGVPVRPTKNEVLQDWIERNRAIEGPEQFRRKGAARPLLRILRSGGAVTMFLDQNERNGIFVDFFGRKASTIPTVGVLAERTGALVYFQVARRVVPGRRYDIRFDGPLTIPDGGTTEERIAAWTQAATARLESAVRENPADWFWVHRRWRTRPPEERGAAPVDGSSPAG